MSCLNDQDKQKSILSQLGTSNLDQFDLLYKYRTEWYKLGGRLNGQVTRFTKNEKQARSSRRWSSDALCSFSPCASSNLRLTLPYQEPMRAGPTYCLYLLPHTINPTPTAIEFLLVSPHALAVGHTLVSQALSSPCTLVPFSWRTCCLAPNALPTFPLHSRTFLH